MSMIKSVLAELFVLSALTYVDPFFCLVYFAWLLLTQTLVLQMLIRNYSQMTGHLFHKYTLKLSPRKMSLTN